MPNETRSNANRCVGHLKVEHEEDPEHNCSSKYSRLVERPTALNPKSFLLNITSISQLGADSVLDMNLLNLEQLTIILRISKPLIKCPLSTFNNSPTMSEH